jgi:RyR domain
MEDLTIGQIIDIAMVCHETNRAYCRSLGDNSQKPWDEAPNWQKQSAMAGVKGLIEHPDLGPEELHAMWCAQKVKDGWQYGDKKDEDKKTHPALIQWDQLPEDERMKDYLFHAVVRTMAKLPPGYVHVH